MFSSYRTVTAVSITLALLLIVTACSTKTPEQQIELKLEKYHGLVIDYGEMINEMDEASSGEQGRNTHEYRELVKKIDQTEFCIRELIETHREEITSGVADAFISKLEHYKQLVVEP